MAKEERKIDYTKFNVREKILKQPVYHDREILEELVKNTDEYYFVRLLITSSPVYKQADYVLEVTGELLKQSVHDMRMLMENADNKAFVCDKAIDILTEAVMAEQYPNYTLVRQIIQGNKEFRNKKKLLNRLLKLYFEAQKSCVDKNKKDKAVYNQNDWLMFKRSSKDLLSDYSEDFTQAMKEFQEI